MNTKELVGQNIDFWNHGSDPSLLLGEFPRIPRKLRIQLYLTPQQGLMHAQST